MANQWFRVYHDITSDPKMKLLAFEDRWHYVALLVFKSSGELDRVCSASLKERMLAVHFGLTTSEMDNLKKRLSDVELIDSDWQPIGWDKRQFVSDNSTDRVRKHRAKSKGCEVKQSCNVSVTPPDTDTDTETDKKSILVANRNEPTEATEVANYLAEKIISVNPKAKPKPKSWVGDIDKAMRIDGRTKQELIGIINWIYAPAGSFWQPNIQSGKKLREKFDTLTMQSARSKQPNPQRGYVPTHQVNSKDYGDEQEVIAGF